MNTKKLVEKNLIWKIDDNTWARKCPKCNNIVHHEGMSSLEVTSRSYRKKCNCIRCNSVGRKYSEEIKKKMSDSHKGYKHTEEQKRKISDSNTGKIRTSKMKLKYSKSKLGEKNPQYGKSSWNEGTEWSKEMKQKLSESHKNQIHKSHSEETKKKIRISLLKRINESGIPINLDKNAPKFFEKLNSKGYNFKSKRFFDIGYDADGYDEEKHIWVEYDSLYHRNVTQQKKDLIRQQNIIKHFESINNPLLGFIRIVENKDGDISSNCVYGKNIIN